MTLNSLTQCLANDFNLSGKLKELYSYQDQSYLLRSDVRGDATSYVVKVMHAGADKATVEMQTTILESLGAQFKDEHDAPGIAKVVRTTNGRTYTSLTVDYEADRLVWVVTYLDGVLAADQQPYTSATMTNLGMAIARLHQALVPVDHSGLHRDFSWKLLGAGWIDAHRTELLEAFPTHANWLKQAIDTFLDPSADGLGNAALGRLQRQTIHGDINEHNVVFSVPGPEVIDQAQTIAGIIDFGDAHNAPRICDVAIAATYFMMNQANPWLVLSEIVAGYHSVVPLTLQEQVLLMPLVRMRIAQSLTHSMLNSKTTQDNYVTISQNPP